MHAPAGGPPPLPVIPPVPVPEPVLPLAAELAPAPLVASPRAPLGSSPPPPQPPSTGSAARATRGNLRQRGVVMGASGEACAGVVPRRSLPGRGRRGRGADPRDRSWCDPRDRTDAAPTRSSCLLS